MHNYGMCNACQATVPVCHEERGNRIYLVKECEACGRTETVVSTNADRWRAKRELARYAEEGQGCDFRCNGCEHRVAPRTVFLDVTNRCNMDCPICIANVPSMGFRFEPPLSYFEKIFDDLARRDPVPSVKLFGGEPLVRTDLSEIIGMAHQRGIPVAVVTNGIGLADEERCRSLLEETRVRLIFSFDGFKPELYRAMRGADRYLQMKLRALENVRKYTGSKITMMCVVGRGINEDDIPELFSYCHERDDFISALQFIPLTQTWEPGSIEADGAAITAMEDVEDIISVAVGNDLEFIPAGLYPYPTFARFFKMSRSTFAGAHPNCESMSYLISNGREYVPLGRYLRGTLSEAVGDLFEEDRRLARRVARFENGLWGRFGLARQRSRFEALKTAALWFIRCVRLHDLLGRNAGLKFLRIAGGLLLGRRLKHLAKRNLAVGNLLFVVVLPFEEPRTLESERLVSCPASFVYEDPDTREVRVMPVCAWCLHKNDIMQRIQGLYDDTPDVRGA